jgi:beta-glucosidase
MAIRILTAWYHSGQDSTSTPAVGIGLPADSTRPHEVVDAREPTDAPILHQSAIEGHVLVKNVNNVLPLRQPNIISVFGYDARPISIYNVGTGGRGTWMQGLDSFRSFICGFFSVRFQSCPPMPAIQFNGTVWTGGGSGAATSTYLISPYEAISAEVRRYGGTAFWDLETYGSNVTVNAESDVCLVFINAIAAEGKE